VAHQGDVAGVVEDFMDIGHVASQERTLDRAINVSDEIQSDGSRQYGGKPSGSLSVAYSLLKHLDHFVPLKINALAKFLSAVWISTGIIAHWAIAVTT
jgi:hypothetical protein